MKVLFLDIDGVLNRLGTKERFNGYLGVDKELLSRLLTWLKERPDVKVVLSSTWRLDPVFTKHLQMLGISWIDVTPDMHDLGRGMEINHWLMKHLDVTHIAILDDIAIKGPMAQYLVQTSEKYGLREKDLIKLNKLLGYDQV